MGGDLRLVLCLVSAFVLAAATAGAQEFEPRAFSQTPVKLNYAALVLGHASGEVLFDRAVPITEAEGRVNNVVAAYVRTMGFFGASAKLTAVVPFAWGDWDGLLDGEVVSTSRSGFADPQLEFSVNFLGAPAMTMSQMRRYTGNTVVGTSFLVTVPLGQYDSDRLVNLGQNRWEFRPRLGFAHRMGRWTIECMSSVRLHTDNKGFYGGTVVAQDPLWAGQADAVYQFRRGFWMGLGIGISRGGRVSSDGVSGDSYNKNTRWGGRISYPLTRTHSFKVTYVNGLKTRLGSDFDKFSVGYQVRWGGAR